MLAHKLLRSFRAGNIQQHATRNTCYSSKCSFYTGVQALRRRAVNIEPAKKKKWASWHEKHQQTMQTYQQATERSIAGLFPQNNHKRQKQNWSNTIHIKNANKKTKMITPPSTDKDKTKVISPQITSKGNCKEKHDLTTNHRQRLPGWRLFRLGIGTTLDRVQRLYPERNYFGPSLKSALRPGGKC